MQLGEPVTTFISYQRADTLFAAHALSYAIRGGAHKAFVDTGSIDGGESFMEVINNAIAESNLMLALIGPNFDSSRLHKASDAVSFEWRRARFYGVTVVPVLIDGAQMPRNNELPIRLHWVTKRNAYHLRRASLSNDIVSLVTNLPLLGSIPRRASRVLWVDDNPSNNECERKELRTYGIIFDNVVSTEEAKYQILHEDYDLLITDLGRYNSSDQSGKAGSSLLSDTAMSIPTIVYAGDWAVESHKNRLLQLGAIEVTASRKHLVKAVLKQLEKGQKPKVGSSLID